MPQIKLMDVKTGKDFNVTYDNEDTIEILKTILKSMGYERSHNTKDILITYGSKILLNHEKSRIIKIKPLD